MITVFLGLALLLWVLNHLFFSKSKPLAIPPPTVIVQQPKAQEMVEYVTQTGTTVALNSVNLVARVEGYLRSIEFVDGSLVKKNQPLFVIQPEPYQEKLKAATATVAAQKAGYDYAKNELARQQRMYKQNATSLNEVEKWSARSLELAAEIDKAIADEEIAKINYSYTHVASPFDGRIGRHLVDVGNLVGNGQATNLATVEQINPLYVYFNLNELDLIRLRAAARAMGITANDLAEVPVWVSLQNDPDKLYKATLDFVNTGLNASTGTMELRATLQNPDYVFLPGLFVQVKVAVTKPTKQLTLPESALLYDQIGPYVYVVGADNKVVLKRVQLGAKGKGVRGITQGISDTDLVIVEGLQFATPGNPVHIEKREGSA